MTQAEYPISPMTPRLGPHLALGNPGTERFWS
jgi:hypothetical protein